MWEQDLSRPASGRSDGATGTGWRTPPEDTPLDDTSLVERLDPTHMWQRLASLPDQLQDTWQQALELELPERYAGVERVVLAGMGGSAIGGDLLADLLSTWEDGPVFTVCRGYRLPPWVDARTLVIACSYSGNTRETLACFEGALDRGGRTIVVTSGGRLADEARARGVPWLEIRYRGEPRTALGCSLMGPLGLLQGAGVIPSQASAVAEGIELLRAHSTRYSPEQPTSVNPAKQLALAVASRIPAFYAGGFLSGVARRWKVLMNENAKSWAFAESLPEANHNAVAGYEFPHIAAQQFVVVLIDSALVASELAVHYRATGDLLERAGVPYTVVKGEGTTPLAHVLTSAFLGDWVSYYAALLNGTDPSPTPAIEHLKQQLDA